MNLRTLASEMVQTALAFEKTQPGRESADERDIARHILREPDMAWHVCETYARAVRVELGALPISQLRGLISEIVLAKIPVYD